jgi:hypothetical protein
LTLKSEQPGVAISVSRVSLRGGVKHANQEK